jgi:tRNA threonylcarbamoyladenosine biosynthesis protein TsaE
MASITTHSPAETEALGEAWGRVAQTGWVIALIGDLGAGKTQLVKGLARGLGITTRVHSPTFTLVNCYSGGRLALYHLDLYRLETREQIIGAGLEEYLAPAGVAVIEWAERWWAGGPRERQPGPGVSNFRWVEFEAVTETELRITYDDFGP